MGNDNADTTIVAIAIELNLLLGLNAVAAIYDDEDTCNGNAKATDSYYFQATPNSPRPDGTVAIGKKLISALNDYPYQTAAIAAVCAHEYGHLLQVKYVNENIKSLENVDKSVVRAELFADYVCGYHAAVRKTRQVEYPAVIQALNQFRAGDYKFDYDHHGTPEERAAAVGAGFSFGQNGAHSPKALAITALQYVQNLTLSNQRRKIDIACSF